MSSVIHFTNCPACGSNNIKKVLSAKDNTVSKEEFAIWQCNECTLRFTQDVPDAASIGAYYKSEDYISHTNTSKGLINRLYQNVRKRTLAQKRELVEKVTGLHAGKLLDVGSGTGAFLNEMKQHGWTVQGLEPDAGARNIAQETFNVKTNDTALFFNILPSSFNVITLWHVLEHVHELPRYIVKLKDLLKANGKLFIAVPNYTSMDAKIYRGNWAAYDVPRHLYHFSPQAMQQLIEKHGMKITEYHPMWFDSFYVSLLSSKSKSGKTGWISAFFSGLLSNIRAFGNEKKCSSIIYVISE